MEKGSETYQEVFAEGQSRGERLEKKRAAQWFREHAKQYSGANNGTTMGIMLVAADAYERGDKPL